MWTSLRLLLLAAACGVFVGCQSRADKVKKIEETREAAQSNLTIANDMLLRGDRNPERRAEFQKAADDARDEAKRLEAELDEGDAQKRKR
jgi:hypothetical protein